MKVEKKYSYTISISISEEEAKLLKLFVGKISDKDIKAILSHDIEGDVSLEVKAISDMLRSLYHNIEE